jgi:hypothetical protein
VAGASAVVERERGDVRDFVGRVSFSADGDAACAGIEGNSGGTDATAELFHDDVHYVDGIAHIDEFELNMDMAEGWTGAPDYTLMKKFWGRGLMLRRGRCFT